MVQATLSPVQIASIVSIRSFSEDMRSELRSSLFDSVKSYFGIPAAHKIKVEVDDRNSPLYGVIIRKNNGMPYRLDSDGKVVDQTTTTSEPALAPLRWFRVPMAQMRDAVADQNYFDDGDADQPQGDIYPAPDSNDQSIIVDSVGDVYLQMTPTQMGE